MVPYRKRTWRSSEANAPTTEVTVHINPRTFHDEELISKSSYQDSNATHCTESQHLSSPPPLSLILGAVSSVGHSTAFHRAVDVNSMLEGSCAQSLSSAADSFTSGLLAVGRTGYKALQLYLSIWWPPTGEPVCGNVLSPLTMEPWH